MLVLSRKKNESIIVGYEEVRITIVEIRGDKVRLGIQAPRDCPVQREEVFNAINIQGPLWETLLLTLQSQYDDRRGHGLPWADPAGLEQELLFKLPTDGSPKEKLVLYIDPAVSAEQFAQAYNLPVLMSGKSHRIVRRPDRPYLLVLGQDGTGQELPTDLHQVFKAVVDELSIYWNPLLPLELLALAVVCPDILERRGLTAAGMVYAEHPPLSFEGYTGLYDDQFRTAFEAVYVPSLMRLPSGQIRWVIHQGLYEGCGVPTAMHIV